MIQKSSRKLEKASFPPDSTPRPIGMLRTRLCSQRRSTLVSAWFLRPARRIKINKIFQVAKHNTSSNRATPLLSREELKMPDNFLDIGFPPSKVSVQGILMTNPGQVDPGYEGRLRFTVINMGSQDFVLREGDVIVSLILMELKNASQSD